jgi:hypothetical protein
VKHAIDTGPVRKKATRKLGGNRDRKLRKAFVRKRRYARLLISASILYSSLLAERLAQDLLTPFRCAACNALALDPQGRNNKREHLCGSCADPAEGGGA